VLSGSVKKETSETASRFFGALICWKRILSGIFFFELICSNEFYREVLHGVGDPNHFFPGQKRVENVADDFRPPAICQVGILLCVSGSPKPPGSPVADIRLRSDESRRKFMLVADRSKDGVEQGPEDGEFCAVVGKFDFGTVFFMKSDR